MKTLALRFSSTKLTSAAFEDAAENQIKFDPIKLTPPVPTVERENGVLLNGNSYSHIKWARNKFSVTISADEIGDTTSATWDFLKNFYLARYRYIAFGTTNGYSITFGNYIEIVEAGGDFPATFVDDIVELPEVSFTFEYKERITQ